MTSENERMKSKDQDWDKDKKWKNDSQFSKKDEMRKDDLNLGKDDANFRKEDLNLRKDDANFRKDDTNLRREDANLRKDDTNLRREDANLRRENLGQSDDLRKNVDMNKDFSQGNERLNKTGLDDQYKYQNMNDPNRMNIAGTTGSSDTNKWSDKTGSSDTKGTGVTGTSGLSGTSSTGGTYTTGRSDILSKESCERSNENPYVRASQNEQLDKSKVDPNDPKLIKELKDQHVGMGTSLEDETKRKTDLGNIQSH